MKHIWAIQTNAVNLDQARAVADAVLACGGDFVCVTVHPLTDEIHFPAQMEPAHLNIIPYGSTAFVQMAMRRGWKGVFHNANFSVPVWMENHPAMLNRESRNMLVGELSEFLSPYAPSDMLFVRPQNGTKAFTGKVFQVEELRSAISQSQLGRYGFPMDLPISVAMIKDIISEARWFIVGGRVIDGAMYRGLGTSGYHIANIVEIEYAQSLADLWLPHHTCVMDVGKWCNGVDVMEFNTVNSSGFYHHDIPKIIAAVNKSLT